MGRRRGWERALVTGASEGIGEAFARELARRGCDVVVVARREERLARLSAELAARHGVEVEVLAADLTDARAIADVEARLEADEQPIDLLINNAGGASQHRPFLELDRDGLDRDAYLNSLALLRLTHAAAKAMARREQGNVINVSAGIAFYPLPGAAAYGASKAFVNSLSEALDYELRDHGVRVTAVCPGFTRTGAQRRLGMNVEHVPRALWMEPQDVAVAALRAAERGRPVSSLSAIGALNAFVGRHLPHRLWVPRVARAQRRLSAAPRRRSSPAAPARR
jgi:short-subunit dehydrogenase